MKQKNLFGEKVEKLKVKILKPWKVYYIHDDEFVWFFVSRTPGGARYAYCNEVGLDFSETFYSEFIIERVPFLDKYIEKDRKYAYAHQINPYEDEFWTRAFYAEGGSFTNSSCAVNEDKVLTVEEMVKRECLHKKEGSDDVYDCQGWDDESVYINSPAKPKK